MPTIQRSYHRVDETITIVHLDELKEGQPIAVRVEGVDLVVVKCRGQVSVLEGRCPYQGALLSNGTVDNGILICNAHGWCFDCISGQKIDDATVRLKTLSSSIRGEFVTIHRKELLDWKENLRSNGLTSPIPPATRMINQLPGPQESLFLEPDLNQIHLILERWSDQFGLIYTLKLAQQPVVVIADTELINQILRKRPKPFCPWRVMKSILTELGTSGVEAAEGESWKRQRQFVMQALGADHLHQFFATIVKVTERLKNYWRRVAYDQRVTEIQKDLMRFVVDTLTDLAFGYDMNTIEKGGDVIQQRLEKILPTLNHRIDSLLPHLGYATLPTDHDFDKDISEILKVVDELIQFNRRLLAQDPGLAAKPTNFLQSLLVAVEKQDSQLTEADVVENILTLLLGGEPTIAGTLSRIVYFMTEHPEVQQKMQEEADKVLGDTEIVKDLRQIERLEYIEAVVYESMRMKSVSRLLFVEPNEDVELDGIQIPQGTPLILLIGYGALQERNFTEADKFKPERWLAQYRSSYEVHNTRAFLPFGAGPRFCPGRNLAMLEIKSVIAMLCRNFNITRVGGLNSMAEQFASTCDAN